MINDKPLTKEEELKKAMEFLDESRFAFACFVDYFKRYVERVI
jgi:hypothetical protein